MGTRLDTVTKRVETSFGSIYAHVAFDEFHRPIQASISTPQKHEDTAVDQAMVALGQAFTELLTERLGIVLVGD